MNTKPLPKLTIITVVSALTTAVNSPLGILAPSSGAADQTLAAAPSVVVWGKPEVYDVTPVEAGSLSSTPSPSGNVESTLFDNLTLALSPRINSSVISRVCALRIPVTLPQGQVLSGYAATLRGYIEKDRNTRIVVMVDVGGAARLLDYPYGQEITGAETNRNLTCTIVSHNNGNTDTPAGAPTFVANIFLSIQRRAFESHATVHIDSLDIVPHLRRARTSGVQSLFNENATSALSAPSQVTEVDSTQAWSGVLEAEDRWTALLHEPEADDGPDREEQHSARASCFMTAYSLLQDYRQKWAADATSTNGVRALFRQSLYLELYRRRQSATTPACSELSDPDTRNGCQALMKKFTMLLSTAPNPHDLYLQCSEEMGDTRIMWGGRIPPQTLLSTLCAARMQATKSDIPDVSLLLDPKRGPRSRDRSRINAILEPIRKVEALLAADRRP